MSPKVHEEYKVGKRKQILDAAQRVFIRKGYQAATMKDVVEESGLSRGGVYLYYGSTEQMMLDVLEAMDRETADLMKWVDQAGSVWGALQAVVRQMAGEVKHNAEGLVPVLYELLIMGWRNKTYLSLMERRFNRSLDTVVGVLRVGVERGEFRPIFPIETVARLIFSFHDGLQVDTLQLGPDLTDGEKQAEAMIVALKYLLGIDNKGEPTS